MFIKKSIQKATGVLLIATLSSCNYLQSKNEMRDSQDNAGALLQGIESQSVEPVNQDSEIRNFKKK